jgi:threonine dehydratase
MREIANIEHASIRLKGQLQGTACVARRKRSTIVGYQIFLQFENLQFTAPLKERGA